MCELAARAPAAVVPLFMARIGLRRATRRAIRPKRRGFPNDSRYSSTRFVCESCSQYSRRSFDETSALLPIETKAERPRLRSAAFSSSARPRAPLWDEKPIVPGGRARGPKVALSLALETAIPRQFGPIRRAPWARTSATSRSSRSRPSVPVSANPAEMTQIAVTPFRRAASTDSRTCAAGTQTIARSGRSGSSSTRGVRVNTGNGLTASVHGVCGSRVLGREDVAEKATSDRLASRRCADHNEARGCEETP